LRRGLINITLNAAEKLEHHGIENGKKAIEKNGEKALSSA